MVEEYKPVPRATPLLDLLSLTPQIVLPTGSFSRENFANAFGGYLTLANTREDRDFFSTIYGREFLEGLTNEQFGRITATRGRVDNLITQSNFGYIASNAGDLGGVILNSSDGHGPERVYNLWRNVPEPTINSDGNITWGVPLFEQVGNDPYNAVVKEIEAKRNKVSEILRDPDKYLGDLSGVNPLNLVLIDALGGREGLVRDSFAVEQNGIDGVIAGYGQVNFIRDLTASTYAVSQKGMDELSKLQKEFATKATSIGNNPTQLDDLNNEYTPKFEENQQKYRVVHEAARKRIMDLGTIAYGVIRAELASASSPPKSAPSGASKKKSKKKKTR